MTKIKIEGVSDLDAAAFDNYNTTWIILGYFELKDNIVYFPDRPKNRKDIETLRKNINNDSELQKLLKISYEVAREELTESHN